MRVNDIESKPVTNWLAHQSTTNRFNTSCVNTVKVDQWCAPHLISHLRCSVGSIWIQPSSSADRPYVFLV